MELSFIRQLADIVRDCGLEELDYAEGDTRVRLYRHRRSATLDSAAAVATPAADAHPVAHATTATHEASPSGTPSPPAPPVLLPATTHTVRAGLVGTFFRGPAPGQPPFVRVGEPVQEGQTLGIVEAMKMLNNVEADASGRVLQVLLEDGAEVRAGTALFLLEPGADHV